MSHALRTAAEVVGLAALAVATYGASIGPTAAAGTTILGVSVSTAATATALTAAGLSVVAGLTAKKPRNIQDPMEWQSDPQAGLPIIWGRAYSGGKVYYRNSWGGSDLPLETICTCYSIGPVKQFATFYVDGVATSINGDQANIPDYGYLAVSYQMGAQPESRQLGDLGPPGLTTASKTSGLAVSSITLKYDTKGSNTMTSEPRCGFLMNGVRVYDPRKDSTYSGGSGTQRSNDETTWSYVGYDNPHLFALTWLIGWRQNGKLVAGVGMPISAIIVDQFVEGANVSDANGWKGGGTLDTTDDKWQRLKDILTAGSAKPLRLGAQVGCLTNMPRVSLATISPADLIGEGSVQATQPVRDRINAVVPRYMAEQLTTTANSDGSLRTTVTWGMVAAAPIVVSDYVTFDGRQRQKQVDYEFVQGTGGGTTAPNQVAQLARYDIENAREFGPITLPLKLLWMGYRPGDVVTANLPELGLNGQDILLLQRKLSPADGSVTMTARSETAAKHPFALGQTTTAPATPSVSGPPLVPTPGSTAWAILAEAISANGTTKPALVVGGAADSSAIDAVIFEYRTWGDTPGDWVSAGSDAPATTGKIITSVQDATAYQVAISYRLGSATGDRLILGPVIAGQTSVPWQTGVTGPNKPDDNATNSADPNSPFGDDDTVGGAKAKVTDATNRIKAVEDAIQSTDLGDTGAANAAKQAAEAARDNAAASATTATDRAHDADLSAQAAQGQAAIVTDLSAAAAQSATLAASVVPASLNKNPSFADFADPTANPANWSFWNSSAIGHSRQAGRFSTYAWDQNNYNGSTNVECGLVTDQNLSPGLGAQGSAVWVVIEATVSKISGDMTGGGVLLQRASDGLEQARIDFARTPPLGAADQIGAGINGYTYSYSKLVQVDMSGALLLYAMTDWNGFNAGSRTSRNLRWHRCSTRLASQGEVLAQQVSDNLGSKADYSQLVALGATEDQARGQLDSRLTAQIDGFTDSGLKRSIAAAVQHTDEAVATEAGARADAIQNITVSYNDQQISLQQLSAALQTVDGNQQVIWQVTETLPDGTAKIALVSTKGGGSAFLVDAANAYFSGNVIVAGSIITAKLADNSVSKRLIFSGGSQTWQGDGTGSGYTPPSGGGAACPSADTPVLLANADRTGPGDRIAAGRLKVGDWIWTQHEETLEWGAYQVSYSRVFWARLYAKAGLPRVTGEHPFWLDGRWQFAADIAPMDGAGPAVQLTIDGAHTFITFAPTGEQVLSHNKTSQA